MTEQQTSEWRSAIGESFITISRAALPRSAAEIHAAVQLVLSNDPSPAITAVPPDELTGQILGSRTSNFIEFTNPKFTTLDPAMLERDLRTKMHEKGWGDVPTKFKMPFARRPGPTSKGGIYVRIGGDILSKEVGATRHALGALASVDLQMSDAYMKVARTRLISPDQAPDIPEVPNIIDGLKDYLTGHYTMLGQAVFRFRGQTSNMRA